MPAAPVPAELFAVVLVFARTGGALMMMPGFGEAFVMPRYRLILAGAITLLITPLVSESFPAMPDSPVLLFLLLASEIIVGVFLGTIGRVIMASLHVAGTTLSFQSGLANALVFDPSTAQQAALPALFLTTTGLLVVFATGLHHLMLRAMVESYAAIGPGAIPPFEDFSRAIARLFADAFILGVQLAAPFIAVGLVFYLGVGLLARLMPQVQIFFIALPVQIFLGFLTLAITVSAVLMWFADRFQASYLSALGG